MKIVQEFQAIKTHDIGLLDDGGGDGAALDPLQSFGIFVEGDDWNLSGEVHAMQCIGCAGAAGSFERNDAVRLFFALQKRGNRVVRVAGIAFVINRLSDFDSRIFLESFVDAANAFAEIELPWNRNNHDVAFSSEQLRHALPTLQARAKVVRADKDNALGVRRIGVHANHRNALLHRGIDGLSENLWSRGGKQDPRW